MSFFFFHVINQVEEKAYAKVGCSVRLSSDKCPNLPLTHEDAPPCLEVDCSTYEQKLQLIL